MTGRALFALPMLSKPLAGLDFSFFKLGFLHFCGNFFYIRDDINRKFSGLITNFNLEKIYGVTREQNTATVYFDYRYTSVRNQGNILYEKGKMTFIKFNSGKWFNAELSIYLMDAYPFPLNPDQKVKEE